MTKKPLITSFILFLFLTVFFHSAPVQAQNNLSVQTPSVTSQGNGNLSPLIPDTMAHPEKVAPAEEKTSQPETPEDIAPHKTDSRTVTEPLSEFERFINGNSNGEAKPITLRQFGYDLFRKPPSTFAPVTNVPVGPGYVIGPGDEVRVTIWGKVEGLWNVTVDRNGNITLPKVGVIGVAGLTFSSLESLLQKEFSKYYTGFEMNVSMGALRTIRVYVVGNALKPGAYSISSLSTLVNALFEAGGPSKTGTMRDIQLKRNGKTIEHFDLYDLLLKGDKTKDARLASEDVIFIPSVGSLVGIAGNVNKPAIYELREEARLLDIINMAGGLTSIAFRGRVLVHRTENSQFRTQFEKDLIDIEKDHEKNFQLQDGDLVTVFPVTEANNTVSLSGAVVNEGEFAIQPGVTRLREVISKAGGLLYYASEKAELTRIRATPSGPESELLNIDIKKALDEDPEYNIPLQINDYILVMTVPEWKLHQKVTIKGEIRFPGIYSIKKGEKLSSLIERAGGYTDKAFLRGAVFSRERVRNIQQKSLEEMTDRLERELLSEASAQVSTALTDEEIKAKQEELKQRQRFAASLSRLESTGRMSIRLAHLRLLKNSEYDIELEEGDSLFIPVKNSVVNVLGAVTSRGSFIYSENMDYKDYIKLAGGYTKYADESNIYVLKVDGTAMKLSDGPFKWNITESRWEVASFSNDIRDIEPGDSIVVSEKLDRIAWLREVKDITQIIYQLALATGVALVVF